MLSSFHIKLLILETDDSLSSSSSMSTSTTSHDSYSSNDHQNQEPQFERYRAKSQQEESHPQADYSRQRRFSHRQSIIARSLNRGQKMWQEAILDPDSSLMPWTKYCNDENFTSIENGRQPVSLHSIPSTHYTYYKENDLYPL